MAEPHRLLSHFATREGSESQKSGWTELWDTDQSDLWDRGTPSVALIDWIESQPVHLPRPTNGRRLRALIPGCGKGYDVIMLALHGFDVVGLEISSKGAEVARMYAINELADPHDYNFGDVGNASNEGAGNVDIMCGDFFDKAWSYGKFDLIYDYTFLCAIHPAMRKDWARRMHNLLDLSGVLVCLEFPLFKSPDEPGPPWPLQGVYWNLLAERGEGVTTSRDEQVSGSGGGYFIRLDYFKPSRSYPHGKGTDMVSIWAHNNIARIK